MLVSEFLAESPSASETYRRPCIEDDSKSVYATPMSETVSPSQVGLIRVEETGARLLNPTYIFPSIMHAKDNGKGSRIKNAAF
jgi:hypothetical protein